MKWSMIVFLHKAVLFAFTSKKSPHDERYAPAFICIDQESVILHPQFSSRCEGNLSE